MFDVKLVAAAAVCVAGITVAGTGARPPESAGNKLTQAEAGKPRPEEIWPAGLQGLAGDYFYAGVASPGGLWKATTAAGSGARMRRQVSVDDLSAAAREKLTHAQITISDIQLPTQIEASQRVSPSKRGMLRFYDESAVGSLVMRNLPGIGAEDEDRGDFSGRVLFSLTHNSHSNPSASGSFKIRQREEPTWGVAALDSADLSATPHSGEGKQDEDAHEAAPIIGNARILRSGWEIFAFVEWTDKDATGEHSYSGSVRLLRRPDAGARQ